MVSKMELTFLMFFVVHNTLTNSRKVEIYVSFSVYVRDMYQAAATCGKICTWGNFFLQEFYIYNFTIKLMPVF
jgi:hypothetical protein